MPLLSIENMKKVFSEGEDDEVVALEDVNLEISDEEFICLVGPSGCGKTTLLRIIAGLDAPSFGSALLLGKSISGPDPKRGMCLVGAEIFGAGSGKYGLGKNLWTYYNLHQMP
ncbi:MAG: ATP-binding cassette domain-containing protein, partial [Methanomicrobium sp.]|nr:ATP-binding cassette domain-containing protein [Methanomicrobium sp.]